MLCDLNNLLPPIPTILSTFSFVISYLNYRRDQSYLSVVLNTDYFQFEKYVIHNSLKKQYEEYQNAENVISIEVCNIGRRPIYINPPVFLWPTGENCSPPNEHKIIKLDEGKIEIYYFPKIYIENFSFDKFGTKNTNWNELQALVMETSGKRWYSKSKSFKFIINKICRIIKRKSFKSI